MIVLIYCVALLNVVLASGPTQASSCAQQAFQYLLEKQFLLRKCFDNLGCIEKLPLGFLPDLPCEVDPTFYMYKNEQVRVLKWDEATFASIQPWLKDVKHFYIFAHGLSGNINKSSYMTSFKDKVMPLHNGTAMFALVDWGNGANNMEYFDAAANADLVGRMVARFTANLMKTAPGKINPKDITFIGHSLGGHIGAYFGRYFKTLTGQTIGRLISLDAAGPLFEMHKLAPKRGDADLVEGWHTSGGSLGILSPYGDISYYINGGIIQPGCGVDVTCYHSRAHQLFVNYSVSGIKCAEDFKCCNSAEDATVHRCNIQCSEADIMESKYNIVYIKTSSDGSTACKIR